MKLGIAVLLLSGALAFACPPPKPKPPVPPTPTPVTATNSNTNSNANTNYVQSSANSAANSTSTSAANANSNQTQGQQQGQTQTATGGNASAQGGNSTSSLSNSGNSSNTNSNVAKGGQGGNASSKSSASNNGNGNGNGSNNTTTDIAAPKIPVATAIAPAILPTVPCFKGMGGAVQTMGFGGSFGGGKVDQGCDDRELARAFSGQQTVASCKILLNTKKAKKAGITMEDCLGKTPEVSPTVQQVVIPEPVAPVIIVEQAPMVLPQAPVVLPKLKRKVVHHLPPNCQNEIVRYCQ